MVVDENNIQKEELNIPEELKERFESSVNDLCLLQENKGKSREEVREFLVQRLETIGRRLENRQSNFKKMNPDSPLVEKINPESSNPFMVRDSYYSSPLEFSRNSPSPYSEVLLPQSYEVIMELPIEDKYDELMTITLNSLTEQSKFLKLEACTNEQWTPLLYEEFRKVEAIKSISSIYEYLDTITRQKNNEGITLPNFEDLTILGMDEKQKQIWEEFHKTISDGEQSYNFEHRDLRIKGKDGVEIIITSTDADTIAMRFKNRESGNDGDILAIRPNALYIKSGNSEINEFLYVSKALKP